jgi:hypothetical protein
MMTLSRRVSTEPADQEALTPTLVIPPTTAGLSLYDALEVGLARVCDTCGQVLELSEFGDTVTVADIHVTTCTGCTPEGE